MIADRGAPLFDSGNTRDYNHATDSNYKKLRAEADALYDKRHKLSQQLQLAYKLGDGAKAHELSEKLKKILEQAEAKNRQAAEYVFRENNTDSAEDEIDLHGLYVNEAIFFLQNRIANSIRTNQSHLRVIVGKGLHSKNGVAKIKPAVDDMCDECNLRHRIDPNNSGVLEIDLSNTHENQIPSSWNSHGAGATINQPQQAYHGNAGPQYHQQPQNNQYHQQQPPFKTGNTFVDLLIKGLCMCLNSK